VVEVELWFLVIANLVSVDVNVDILRASEHLKSGVYGYGLANSDVEYCVVSIGDVF